MIRLIVAALCLSFLSACGWQLRGSEGLPDNLQAIHLGIRDDSSDVARDLRKTLVNYQIDLLDQPGGQYSLILFKEKQDKRVVSLSIDALANEYELSMSAHFRILGPDGQIVLPNTQASVTRSFDHDPSDALSKSEEERLLRREMRADLIAQIIRQLRFVMARQ